MGAKDRLRAAIKGALPAPPGYVDRADAERVAGWAVDRERPDRPALVSLHVDGRHVLTVAADLPREDVARDGRAPIRCGFDLRLPDRVRDGAAHVVELRAGEAGPRLRGGRIRIAAGSVQIRGQGEALSDDPAQGAVWFDRPRAALSGWAMGCGSVSVSIDGGPVARAALDRRVPGFAEGNRQGFRMALPEALADGAWHAAEIRAGDWSEGIVLDGAPLRFRLGSARPRLTVAAPPGRIEIDLVDAGGGPATAPVRVTIDGAAAAAPDPDAEGRVALARPEGAAHLVVATRPSGADPAMVLGRYVLSAGGGALEWSAEAPDARLDLDPLPDDLLAEARAAFDAFAAAPDARFDAAWVAAVAGLDGPGEALPHWRDGGARAGLPPGPGFDEAAARALHPGAARAVADGAIPCAFALELALGPGSLGTLTGLAARRARAPLAPATPVPGPLPPPTAWTPAPDGIYAAWLARLDADPATRGALEAEERATRAEIATTALAERPLVSVIMPTWNRAFTIGEAIQSVIEQSHPDWELLVCDDDSQDRTADVVHGFDDPRIRYMRHPKANGAVARNHGLRAAAGGYVAYLDSDNLWHPLHLDLMLRRLMGAPGMPLAYAAYLDTETVGARVRLRAVSRPAFRPLQLTQRNFVDLNAIVHHRRVTDWLGGFDPTLPRLQDWDMVLRHAAVFGARLVDRVGVLYRRNIAWGQVTETQIASGAQDVVSEKTRARMEGQAPERLRLAWPARPRLTILEAGPASEGRVALAEGMAALAEGQGAARRLALGADGLPAGLAEAPEALGAAIGEAAPILALGLGAGAVARADAGPGAPPVLGLGRGPLGTTLEPGGDPRLAFPLGAVPLAAGRAPGHDPDGPVLILRPRAWDGPGAPMPADEAAAWRALARRDRLAPEAAAAGEALLLPPRDDAPWRRLAGAGAADLDGPAPVAAVAVLGPVRALSPYETALLAGALAEGVPLALPAEAAADGLAAQALEAEAAWPLERAEGDAVLAALAALRADAGARARLSERARLLHAANFAPWAARERLAHLLWRLVSDPPRVETRDA